MINLWTNKKLKVLPIQGKVRWYDRNKHIKTSFGFEPQIRFLIFYSYILSFCNVTKHKAGIIHRNVGIILLNILHCNSICILYRVSQEECEILRETVPYVKLYRWAIRRLMLFIFFLPLWVFGTRHRDLLSAQGFSDPIGWPSRTGGWEGGVVFYSKGSIMCKQGEILRPSTCTDSPSDRREEGTLRF